MRSAPRLAGFVAALLLPLPGPADEVPAQDVPVPDAAAPADGHSAEKILECVRENQPSDSARQQLEFRSQDRAGGGRTIHSRMRWRRFEDGLSRVLVRVRAPNDLKDSGVLLIEKPERAEMFVYLPDLQRVKTVTSRMLSGAMFGSDFTYEDFREMMGMAVEGRAERLADADLEGVPVYVVTSYPASGSGSAYERVTYYIEMETCVPLKNEMFEKGDKLRKVMTVDRTSIFEQNGVRLPTALKMEDHRNESHTDLLVTGIEVGVEVRKRDLTTNRLAQPR